MSLNEPEITLRLSGPMEQNFLGPRFNLSFAREYL